MNKFDYVMVTNWDKHWDGLKASWNNSTIFSFQYINDGLELGPWPQEVRTLFIKKDKANKFEKSWVGISKNFREDTYKGSKVIRFDVSDLKECECSSLYSLYTSGWYTNKFSIEAKKVDNPNIGFGDELYPAFFRKLDTCTFGEFESYVFQILRLIGIHDIKKFPQQDNRGKADGFFNFQTLSVVYDATLESNFEGKKAVQIDNYISQLKTGKINFSKTVYTIKDSKQVWIITRGSQTREIRIEDGIKVKEVPISSLIKLYLSRLLNEIDMDEFADQLKNI